MSIRVALLASCLSAHLAAAETPHAPPVMSLRQAIDFARAHQPSLAAARARVAVARAQAEIPRAAYAPRFAAAAEIVGGTTNNTTTSYATFGALDVARIGGTPANAHVSLVPDVSTMAGVVVHKELYDFGRIDAAAAAFDELARAADETSRSVDLDLALLVEESFYGVQGSKAVLAAAEAAIQRSQAHHDLAAANVRAQLRPPIELTRADADLARFEVDRVRAAGAVAISQSALAAAIGSSEPAIDAGIDDVAFLPPAIQSMHDVDARSPEIRAGRAVLAAQQHFTEAIRDELKPDFSISAEVTGRAGGAAVSTNPTPFGAGWLPDVPNWDALVVFTWPLYDRVVTTRARTSERVEAVRAAELDQITEQLHAVIERSSVELEIARAALPALQRALDAASANQAQADARFKAALGTAVELSDAEALLTDAQIQLAIGQFQLSRARARSSRARGETIP